MGANVRVRLVLQPDWAGVVDAVGGGPALVRDGKAVFNAGEAFVPQQLALPEPRTAVGQLADGRIVLVVVDGRRRGYSSGMTNFELALALVRLGAVTGAALDGGGSSTMAFDGQLLNRPSGAERPVSEALLMVYSGVHAPLPSVSVVSPNGDDVAETQELAYKVVRPSTVNASLVAPDGSTRPVFAGQAVPSTYAFEWTGRTADGALEPEGAWRWVVERDRRSRAGFVRRAAVLAQHDARVRQGRRAGAVGAAPPRESGRAVRAGPGRVRDDSDRDPLGNGDQEGGSGGDAAGRRRERHVGRPDEQGRDRPLGDLRRAHDGEELGRLRRPDVEVHGAPDPLIRQVQPLTSSWPVLIASITSSITDALTSFIGDQGVYAVFLLMFVDAVLPAASELVMVYAGALAAGAFAGQQVVVFGREVPTGWQSFTVMVSAGTIGYTLGSLAGWAIGDYGGRPLVERHGKWFHLSPERFARAERWFDRWGGEAVFLGRITPIVRSFVSIPAGVFRHPLGRYTLLTFIGSTLWCLAFAGIGWAVGENWESFHHAFRYVEYVVAGLIVVGPGVSRAPPALI